MSNKCEDMWRQWRERIGIGSSANQQTLAGALFVFFKLQLANPDGCGLQSFKRTALYNSPQRNERLWSMTTCSASSARLDGFPIIMSFLCFFCASNRGCTIPFFPHLLTKFSSCCFTQVTAKAFQSKWSKFVWGPSLGWGLPTFDSVLSTFSSSGDSLLLHLNICQQAALKCSHWATRMACHTVQKLTFYRDGITTKLQ